jgi:membrane fusion protein (multidrug efflux system)
VKANRTRSNLFAVTKAASMKAVTLSVAAIFIGALGLEGCSNSESGTDPGSGGSKNSSQNSSQGASDKAKSASGESSGEGSGARVGDGLKAEADKEHETKEHEAGEHASKALPTVPTIAIKKEKLEKELRLPGELVAYQNVPIHAKVEGFVKWIGVDRGSIVKKGQKMITVFCPELDEKEKEGAAKLAAAESSFRRAQAGEDSVKSMLVEAKARLDADQLTYQRLQAAAQTPGAVAQNEVDIQAKSVESDKARVDSIVQEVSGAHNLVVSEGHNVRASQQVLASLKDMTNYLTLTAPFDGVITERNVHEGSIVAVDSGRTAEPMVRIQQKDVLRLVVAVPEDSVSGTKLGEKIAFTVPAFVGKTFYGVVARPAYALDNATRTMPVELSVNNSSGDLEPGMFATVSWQVTRPYETLFVPSTAVESDLKGTFVIRVKDNTSERVEIQRGLSMGDQVEVNGTLQAGDMVALKATDELKTGTHLIAKVASGEDIRNSKKHGSSGGE